MDINAFLNRIVYQENIDVIYPVLAGLQKAFLHSVPFENLDIHADIKLDYSEKPIFDKIVTRRRGGVCYESNALFYDALNGTWL